MSVDDNFDPEVNVLYESEFDDSDEPTEISMEEVVAKMSGGQSFGSLAEPPVRDEGLGRNHKCPCGSGKRFKRCHGR
jgi:preprotein translocase subunit SecA